MLAYSIYSVISPEGCAAILWRSDEKKQEAAKAMGITAGDLQRLGIIDEILPEPPGGAHADPEQMFAILDEALQRNLADSMALRPEERIQARHEKFRGMGSFRTR